MGKTSVEQMDIGSAFENRFYMSVAIAKRAKQLKDGVRPLVPFNRESELLPIEVALDEVRSGKVLAVVKDKKETHHDFLDEMDQLLDSEIEISMTVEEEKKSVQKDKSKLRKSLGA